MDLAYWTLQERTRIELRIKRSLFIGEAIPVQTDEEALCLLEEVRLREAKATHHCYAYVLGGSNPIQYQRFSDAGEPSGTAGRPILDAILGRELHQVLVVVTRYFGGILLGAGGLVHAYSEAAIAALQAGETVCFSLQELWSCEISYSVLDRFRYLLNQHNMTLVSETFAEQVQLLIAVQPGQSELLAALLREQTAGQGQLEYQGQEYQRRIYV